jgi:hypothetical protein
MSHVQDGECFCKNASLTQKEFPETEAFRTETRGYGLRLKDSIRAGTIVAEYTGEVIRQEECESRMADMLESDDFYFASLSGGLVLDASAMGSEARFSNHSCEPNAELQKWIVASEPRLALVALRDCTYSCARVSVASSHYFSGCGRRSHIQLQLSPRWLW